MRKIGKLRRRSGRVYPNPTIPPKILLEENLELESFWDEWEYYRDCSRGYCDHSKIQSVHQPHAEYFETERFNQKNKLLLQRRKASKQIAGLG